MILNNEIRSIKSDISSLQTELSLIKRLIVKGFETLHNFGRDRAMVLVSVSHGISFDRHCNGSSTHHNFYFHGRVG
jgi:prefoldin subunit 5